MSEIRALLFDLGGVVIEIDFDRVLKRWEGISALSFDELKAKFQFDVAYEQHERGEIDAVAYFAHLRDILQLAGSDYEIAAGWNSVFVSDLPTVRAVIAAAREHVPTFAGACPHPHASMSPPSQEQDIHLRASTCPPLHDHVHTFA